LLDPLHDNVRLHHRVRETVAEAAFSSFSHENFASFSRNKLLKVLLEGGDLYVLIST